MRLCRFINDLKAAPRILLITESLVPDFRPRIGRCCAAAWSCEPVLPVCIDGERHFSPQFSMSSLLTVDSDLRFPGKDDDSGERRETSGTESESLPAPVSPFAPQRVSFFGSAMDVEPPEH